MKDDEIKLWKHKAKNGLLRNDSTLSQTVNNIRLALATSVNIDGADNQSLYIRYKDGRMDTASGNSLLLMKVDFGQLLNQTLTRL